MSKHNSGWINLPNGEKFFPLDPTPDQSYRIEDIALSLSRLARFRGFTRHFYSVGQHSVLVAQQLDPSIQMLGLLHDSPEAYMPTGDIPSPLKDHIFVDNPVRSASTAEGILAAFLLRGLGVDLRFASCEESWEAVEEVDRRMCATEARDLFDHRHSDWVPDAEPYPFQIEPWTMERAYDEFLTLYYQLKGKP